MKKLFHLNFRLLTSILILLIFTVGGLSYADTNGVWTYASDVTNGTFGSDQQILNMNYSFINPVYFYDSLIGHANKTITKGLLANGISGYSNNFHGSAIYGYASYGAYSGYFEDGPFVINLYNGKNLTFRNGILTVHKTIITTTLNSTSINNIANIQTNSLNAKTINTTTLNSNLINNKGNIISKTIITTTLNSTSINNIANIETNTLNAKTINTTTLNSNLINNKGNIQTNSLNAKTINTNTLSAKKIYLNGKLVVIAPPICDGQNQFLQWNGNNWLCGSVTFPAPLSCTLDGATVKSGSSYTFFNTKVSTSCSTNSLSRLCTNGNLGGTTSYQYSSCSAPLSCTLNGTTFNSGSNFSFYNKSFSISCSSDLGPRTCTDGVLGGNSIYKYSTCTSGNFNSPCNTYVPPRNGKPAHYVC